MTGGNRTPQRSAPGPRAHPNRYHGYIKWFRWEMFRNDGLCPVGDTLLYVVMAITFRTRDGHKEIPLFYLMAVI